MLVTVSWWWMEWLCRWLWALYPPNIEFPHDPHVNPVHVAMALNPAHWGRFVAYSMWLQAHTPHLTDRIIIYKTLLHQDPQFILCFYHLLGRWLLGTLWPKKEPRRRPTRTHAYPVLWVGCVTMPEPKPETCHRKV